MYVRNNTTPANLRKKITAIEEELNQNKTLSVENRLALEDELDYLYSFLTVEPEQV